MKRLPDGRHLYCQMALESRYRAAVAAGEAEGWTETAYALLQLAGNHLKAIAAKVDTERQIRAAASERIGR